MTHFERLRNECCWVPYHGNVSTTILVIEEETKLREGILFNAYGDTDKNQSSHTKAQLYTYIIRIYMNTLHFDTKLVYYIVYR